MTAVGIQLMTPHRISVCLLGGLCPSGCSTSCGVHDWHWPYTMMYAPRMAPTATRDQPRPPHRSLSPAWLGARLGFRFGFRFGFGVRFGTTPLTVAGQG